MEKSLCICLLFSFFFVIAEKKELIAQNNLNLAQKNYGPINPETIFKPTGEVLLKSKTLTIGMASNAAKASIRIIVM